MTAPLCRQGQPLTFHTSEEFDACPKLKGRADGPCSAVWRRSQLWENRSACCILWAPDKQPPTEPGRLAIGASPHDFWRSHPRHRARFASRKPKPPRTRFTGLVNRRTLESELKKIGVDRALVNCGSVGRADGLREWQEPSPGLALAKPTFRTPGSICFSKPNEVFVHDWQKKRQANAFGPVKA